MDIRITGAPTGGTVKAIPSKSAAHRVMIAAALSGIDLTPYCEGLSQDITATKVCLQTMASCIGERRNASAARLLCGESGSTLRFLIPVCGVLGMDADFVCEGRLADRPMEPFLTALSEHGCSVTGRDPKMLRGRLKGGDFRLPGNISSQYVTGLLMALPLAEEDSRIIVEGSLQSRPYIDLTLQVLAKAGISTDESREGTDTVFRIRGGQKYQLPQQELEHIEGDWSNGAFWITMDAMIRRLGPGPAEETPVIRCAGLDPGSVQGDRAILEVIERLQSADEMLRFRDDRPAGGSSARLDISPGGRGGFVELDVADIPDLVPIISAFACGRPRGAVTHIANAQRLRYKESDRLKAVTEVLTALGADITEESAGLMIRGTATLRGGQIDAFRDHRIAMMAAAAACIAADDIVIRGAEAVNKSYPGFFDDYQRLGGSLTRIDEDIRPDTAKRQYDR